jgi:hypothetical protein
MRLGQVDLGYPNQRAFTVLAGNEASTDGTPHPLDLRGADAAEEYSCPSPSIPSNRTPLADSSAKGYKQLPAGIVHPASEGPASERGPRRAR